MTLTHLALSLYGNCCMWAGCGVADPDMLVFHHRDPAQKESGVARLLRRKTWSARLEAELAKCDLLCANHHSKIHALWRKGEFVVYKD